MVSLTYPTNTYPCYKHRGRKESLSRRLSGLSALFRSKKMHGDETMAPIWYNLVLMQYADGLVGMWEMCYEGLEPAGMQAWHFVCFAVAI